jgi:hypothetical protein
LRENHGVDYPARKILPEDNRMKAQTLIHWFVFFKKCGGHSKEVALTPLERFQDGYPQMIGGGIV